jgi:hypothetical protein
MFEIKLENPETFNKLIDSTSLIVDSETTFVISKKEFFLQQMDKPRFAQVTMKLKPKFFNSFNCKKEHIICIRINELKKILNRMSKSPDEKTISIKFKDKENFISISNSNKTFTLPLLDPDDFNRINGELKPSVVAKLSSGALTEYIQDAIIVDNSIQIKAENDTLIFYANENVAKSSTGKLTTSEENSNLLDLKIESDSKSQYSLESLKKIISLDQYFKQLTLSFATNRPILISFSEENLLWEFMIAPERPEEEEDEEEEEDDEYDEEEEE